VAPSPDPDPAFFREVQRLRSRVAAPEVENQDLKTRLAYAWSEVEHVRSQLGRRPRQAAEPVERKQGPLVAVTSAELEAVVVRLRDVRPLALGGRSSHELP